MRLPTWTPRVRPTQRVATLHGDVVDEYLPISLACRTSGEALRTQRRLRGLTLGQAAEQLGLSVVELSECEHGMRGFDLAQAVYLLEQHRREAG